MVKVGSFCIDKYEASVWTEEAGAGTQIGQSSDNYDASCGGTDTGNAFACYAYSQAAVTPARYITWFQAQQACGNAGKRLCTNAEWQMAAAGTPDPGADGGVDGCNVASSGTPATTGAHSACVSRWDAYDMIGNLWEWVADWYVAGTNYANSGLDGTAYTNWPTGYGSDTTWNVGGRAYNGTAWVDGLPAAAIRGGCWGNGTYAGVFAFYVHNAPSSWSNSIGFRCCK